MKNLSDYPHRKKIESYAEKYDLRLPERQQTMLMGELSGKRTGSSIEYQDRKDYVPGDDVRHIDWRAYARNDKLTIKLYREEICPTVDIIVDTSLSMAVTDAKAIRRLDLTYLFYLLAFKLHATVSMYSLANRLERIGNPFDLIQSDDHAQDDPIPLLQRSPLSKKSGIKILISDLLFPFDPAQLLATFAAADRVIIIQVLSLFEDEPDFGGEVRLQDAENGRFMDIRLDRPTLDGYKKRLNNIRNDLDRRMKAASNAFCCVRDEDALDVVMKKLYAASVVEA